MNKKEFELAYQTIGNVLVEPKKALGEHIEIPEITKNLLVDWDKLVVEKAMEKLIRENGYYHIEYAYNGNCLAIKISRQGHYLLNQDKEDVIQKPKL